MKIITQNLHCFSEENYLEKFHQIAQFIVDNEIDVACFQEVAQPIGNAFADSEMRLREGNAGLLIRDMVAQLGGSHYEVVFSFAHYYYGTDEEGVAILTRIPIQHRKEHVISEEREIVVERRTAIEVHLEGGLSVSSVHLGIKTEGNAESPALAQFLNLRTRTSGDVQLYFGDYNIPDTTSGYEGIIESGCVDLFEGERGSANLFTTPNVIDGWHNHSDKGAKRLDYGFANKSIAVREARVIFDGKVQPMVSDHFGVYFHLDL